MELGEEDSLFEGFGPPAAFGEDEQQPVGDVPGAHPAEPATGLHEARVYALPPLSLPAETPELEETPVALGPDDEIPAEDETPAEPAPEKSPARPARRGRSKVPSWDEIVFGGKQD